MYSLQEEKINDGCQYDAIDSKWYEFHSINQLQEEADRDESE